MNKCLKIELNKIKDDIALSSIGRGTRKIIVTDIYQDKEKEANRDIWEPPILQEKCSVLRMSNIEMSFFNENAKQDRHYHKEGTEIYMVIEGEFIIEVEEKIYHLFKGDTIIVHPYSIHYVKNVGNRYLCRMINVNCGGEKDKFVV
ncbi:cupin domain-containing protein [Nitrosophilus labii]|uniref:cupin domain-containing protein n=1 Tax=Nitrosophilus labii TaxID=2706014 RepID=UPI001656DF39|nr:cupin domain-containing protein [Nitrosophilus labii]